MNAFAEHLSLPKLMGYQGRSTWLVSKDSIGVVPQPRVYGQQVKGASGLAPAARAKALQLHLGKGHPSSNNAAGLLAGRADVPDAVKCLRFRRVHTGSVCSTTRRLVGRDFPFSCKAFPMADVSQKVYTLLPSGVLSLIFAEERSLHSRKAERIMPHRLSRL